MSWKEIGQVILFFLSWLPVAFLAVGPVLGTTSAYNYDFSIYNNQYNGLSQFSSSITDTGREVLSIQASMSVASRYNGSAVIAIMGPVRDFSLDAAIVIFTHLLAGGSVLIADDFGSANASLGILNTFLGGMTGDNNNSAGLLTFLKGVLFDLGSYDTAKEPRLPIIRDLRAGMDGGALTAGVSEIHLNWASAINPYSLLGQAGIAWTTPLSWCEKNITDPAPFPDPDELNGSLPVAGALDLSGGRPGSPSGGRIVAISDPSVFNNDMWGRWAGNRRFGANIIEWLTNGDTTMPVLFCEQLLEVPYYESEFFFGLYLGRVLWLSSLPILSGIYPLFTTLGIRKYLPDIKKPEVKSVSDVFLRRGQTYFSERMTYYREEGNYTRVIKMLYRRLRRGLRKTQQWTEYSPEKVWDVMRYRDSKLKQDEFFKMVKRIEEISSDSNIKIKESEMMALFFFMQNIQSHMIDTTRK